MLKDIIDLLNENDWLISDEDVLIAKGKYHSTTNWKEFKYNLKQRRL